MKRLYTEDGVNNLYYHDGVGNYTNADQEAGDNSYRYSGGNYKVADAYKDDYETSNFYTSATNMIEALTFGGMNINGKVVNLEIENGEYNMLLAIAEEYCSTVADCNPQEVVDAAIADSEDTIVTEYLNFYNQGITTGKYFYVYGFTFSDELYVPIYDVYDLENDIVTTNYNYRYDIIKVLAQSGYLDEDVKNYVCFGSDEETCPTDNLYRIIGVFNGQVKLIKADYTTEEMLGTNSRDYSGAYLLYGEEVLTYYEGTMSGSEIAAYRWNYDTSVSENGSNNWITSELNTINLNTNYWNYLGTTWQNLIAQATWHLGKTYINSTSPSTAKSIYNNERNNNVTYTDEIGLMYASDYGYAANPGSWSLPVSQYYMETENWNDWLYLGTYEWAITPIAYYGDGYTYQLYVVGQMTQAPANAVGTVRPVFYLKSDVILTAGTGTQTDPYRIA